jgi:hypothetical protein
MFASFILKKLKMTYQILETITSPFFTFSKGQVIEDLPEDLATDFVKAGYAIAYMPKIETPEVYKFPVAFYESTKEQASVENLTVLKPSVLGNRGKNKDKNSNDNIGKDNENDDEEDEEEDEDEDEDDNEVESKPIKLALNLPKFKK